MNNKVSPKSLTSSKWTKKQVTNKEKHFIVTKVKYDDDQNVTECILQAVITKNEYAINWRELKNEQVWLFGWR